MKSARPAWLNKKIDFSSMHDTERLLAGLSLRTVCHQAKCPNISECFSRGTATFLIMGDICTRGCAFCGVSRGTPSPAGGDEPGRVADAVARMRLRHVVITSVTRDDLPDGGACHFAEVVRKIKDADDSITVETLVPDFRGDDRSIRTVTDSGPDIFGHNIETVPRLYAARTRCDYSRSLSVLETAKRLSSGIRTKSALMLGMGETAQEVVETFKDLLRAGCDYLSIGQYLQPAQDRLPVAEYVQPARFDVYRQIAIGMGFMHVESGVYVRSSYRADQYV